MVHRLLIIAAFYSHPHMLMATTFFMNSYLFKRIKKATLTSPSKGWPRGKCFACWAKQRKSLVVAAAERFCTRRRNYTYDCYEDRVCFHFQRAGFAFTLDSRAVEVIIRLSIPPPKIHIILSCGGSTCQLTLKPMRTWNVTRMMGWWPWSPSDGPCMVTFLVRCYDRNKRRAISWQELVEASWFSCSFWLCY